MTSCRRDEPGIVSGRWTTRILTCGLLIEMLACSPSGDLSGETSGDGDGDSNESPFGSGGGAVGGTHSAAGGSGAGAGFGIGGSNEGAGGFSTGGGSPSAGGSPSTLVPVPSPGCGSPSTSVTVSNAIVGLPDGYDGSTPVPVIFAFHAANNPNTQLQSRFGDTVIGDEHLMIYLKSAESGWTGADKSRFNTAMDQVTQNACVDLNRIYALGHSSGAQFIVQLLCDGEDRFDAIIPIASSVYCSSWDPVPTLNMHGTEDEEREAYNLFDGNGQKDIVPYVTSNQCESSTLPSDIDTAGCPGSITPGCVEYQGCSVRTTWCNHDDPQYGTSNHGIPCFATSAISDFLSSL